MSSLVTLEAPLKQLAGAAWSRLAQERLSGYSEAAHHMQFRHLDGFTGRDEMQRGDIFARALIADALCDGWEACLCESSAILQEECDYLVAHRQPSGVGGWSYFPDLPELPPDTDCLAQVMQVLVRCQRVEDLQTCVETPLQALLADGVHGDGSLDTWIVPRFNRTAAQTRQAALATALQGSTFDVEVIANFLYAVTLYAPERFAEVLRRGVHYVQGCQESAGSWSARWYSGPYYGTYVCARILAGVEDTGFLSRVRAFQLQAQRSDGSWGQGEAGDQLSTALAVCGLMQAAAQLGTPASDLEVISRGVEWLACNQERYGWQASRFIRRGKRVHYGSSAITASYALKMAAGIRKTFA